MGAGVSSGGWTDTMTTTREEFIERIETEWSKVNLLFLSDCFPRDYKITSVSAQLGGESSVIRPEGEE